MSQVRIAVAGAGLIGKRHIEEVDASDSAVPLKNCSKTSRVAFGLWVRIRDTSARRSASETGSPARIFLSVGSVVKCFLSSASMMCS